MSATTLPREALPQAKAQFIAYGAPTRAAHPKTGDPVTVRPQTFVTYYTDILVKEVNRGGRNGGDTVAVHFDPESVGLKENLSGYLDTDDPLVPMLEQAQQNGTPLHVAIESARRVKTKSGKTQISPLTHIHALRGAQPDGSKASMDKSGENIRKLISMVNGVPSKGIVSDPREWAILVDNKTGDLPPEGWRNFAVGDTWEECGAAVRSDEAATTGGPGASQSASGGLGGITPDALAAMIGAAVNDALTRREQAAAGAGPDRPNRVNTSTRFEDKPWTIRTADGRANLGSYATSGYGYAFRWAHKYVTDQNGSAPEPSLAWQFAEASIEAASRVQVGAYAALVETTRHHQVAPDLMANSHTESRRWVEWAAENVVPFPESGTPSEEWIMQVVQVAGPLLADSGRRGLATLGRASQQKTQPAPRGAQDRPAPEADQGQPSAPTPGPEQGAQGDQGAPAESHDGLLNEVANNWGDANAIRRIGSTLRQKGVYDLAVSLNVEQDRPVLSHPPVPGQPSGPLGALLGNRWSVLTSNPQSAQPPAQQEQAAPAPAPAADVASDPTPAPAPVEYPQEVKDTMRAINDAQGAMDMNTIRSLSEQARANGSITATVTVRGLDTGSIAFGPADVQGDKHTIAEVLDALRVLHENADTSAPTPGSAPTPPTQEDHAPAPAKSDAQEQGNAGESVSPAQALADRAANASTLEELREIEDEAKNGGLMNHEVTVVTNGRPATGSLGRLVSSTMRRLNTRG